MAKKLKDILFKKRFRVRKNRDEYTFKLKRRRCWWWLLLLLLPLLLFVNCSHDVTVTVTTEDGEPVKGIKVDMSYSSHWLYNGDYKPAFFADKNTTRSEVTGKNGKALFKDVKTSIFGYIFYCTSKEKFTFNNMKCVAVKDNPLEKNFHFTRNVSVVAERKRTGLKLQVIDKEDQNPIAGAEVAAYWSEGKNKKKANGKTDPNGMVTLKGVWTCAKLDSITSKAYAYNDTTILNKDVDSIMSVAGQNIIPMSPVKESFTFFVKDIETKNPIPGAKCKVTIKSKNINKSDTATTNVDGKGKGEYKNAPITSIIEIDPVTAQNYNQGKLELDSALRVVEKFITLSDDQRTIWLTPKENTLQFQDVDSLNGKGVKGVTNKITITGPGNRIEDTQISNSNGFFSAAVKNGYTIEIISECDGYKQKKTIINNFDANTTKDVKIKLEPILVDLTFKTIDEDFVDKLVPNCTLSIYGSISESLQPTNSGNGEFTVKNVRLMETISIVAKKPDYKTNDFTIKNKNVEYLNNPQTPASARDIPMKLLLPDCDFNNYIFKENGQKEQRHQFNTGKRSGELYFTYNTGDEFAERIRIYDCSEADYLKNPNMPYIWESPGGFVLTPNHDATGHCHFNSNVITVVVVSEDPNNLNNTIYSFIPQCPE